MRFCKIVYFSDPRSPRCKRGRLTLVGLVAVFGNIFFGSRTKDLMQLAQCLVIGLTAHLLLAEVGPRQTHDTYGYVSDFSDMYEEHINLIKKN